MKHSPGTQFRWSRDAEEINITLRKTPLGIARPQKRADTLSQGRGREGGEGALTGMIVRCQRSHFPSAGMSTMWTNNGFNFGTPPRCISPVEHEPERRYQPPQTKAAYPLARRSELLAKRTRCNDPTYMQPRYGITASPPVTPEKPLRDDEVRRDRGTLQTRPVSFYSP